MHCMTFYFDKGDTIDHVGTPKVTLEHKTGINDGHFSQLVFVVIAKSFYTS